MGLSFRVLDQKFTICQLAATSPIPDWALGDPFVSITRTAQELSIVCRADSLPPEVLSNGVWVCLMLAGPFSLDQVGILSAFIGPLATAQVPVFAISTFNTDCVLIPAGDWDAARRALCDAGHQLT